MQSSKINIRDYFSPSERRFKKKQKLHQTVEQSYLLRKYEQLKINKLDYDQKEQNREQSK